MEVRLPGGIATSDAVPLAGGGADGTGTATDVASLCGFVAAVVAFSAALATERSAFVLIATKPITAAATTLVTAAPSAAHVIGWIPARRAVAGVSETRIAAGSTTARATGRPAVTPGSCARQPVAIGALPELAHVVESARFEKLTDVRPTVWTVNLPARRINHWLAMNCPSLQRRRSQIARGILRAHDDGPQETGMGLADVSEMAFQVVYPTPWPRYVAEGRVEMVDDFPKIRVDEKSWT